MVRPEDSLVALPSALSRQPQGTADDRPTVPILDQPADLRLQRSLGACLNRLPSARSRSHGSVASRWAGVAGGAGDGAVSARQPAGAPGAGPGRSWVDNHLVGLRLSGLGDRGTSRLGAGALNLKG